MITLLYVFILRLLDRNVNPDFWGLMAVFEMLFSLAVIGIIRNT